MNKKVVFITAIIGFPIALIAFFQLLSEPRLDIPVFYESGVKQDTLMNMTCIERSAEQYYVQNGNLPVAMHRVVHFERMDGPVLKTRLEELERVQDRFYDQPKVAITSFVNAASMSAKDVTDYSQRIQFMEGFWRINELDSATWSDLKYCDLVMSKLDNRVVLIDSKDRIRGYFNIMERSETDRLIDELGVLLTNKELQ
ncbi:MAG: hypothetical protein Roseis2KO_17670 [Roseivirga sp.]